MGVDDQLLAAVAGGLVGALGSLLAISSQIRQEGWREYMARNSAARGGALSALTESVLIVQRLRNQGAAVTGTELDAARASLAVLKLMTLAAPNPPLFHGYKWNPPSVQKIDELLAQVDAIADSLYDMDLQTLRSRVQEMHRQLLG